MPEVGDYFIGTETIIPKGYQMERGHLVVSSHDANGNVMGRSHANPVLDTRTYQVEFAGAKLQS